MLYRDLPVALSKELIHKLYQFSTQLKSIFSEKLNITESH